MHRRLTSGLDFIFGNPIPPDQRAQIAQYTRELTDSLEKVVLAALAARAPASLTWGQGRVGFAANRRVLKDGHWVDFGVNPNGPVDHSLPVLEATDSAGKVRAVLFGYACHCTTLGGEFNKICAEWAGYACDEIERQSPGSIALAVIGCGADANPEPGASSTMPSNMAWPQRREVDRAGQVAPRPLARPRSTPDFARSSCHWSRSRTEPSWRTVPRRRLRGLPGPDLLERLDRGESLPTTVLYPVQTWCFGDDMAMVFMAGEVVVDYALRLKWEIDQNGSGSWPTATMCPATSRRGGS